jgi:hypothetical protein
MSEGWSPLLAGCSSWSIPYSGAVWIPAADVRELIPSRSGGC